MKLWLVSVIVGMVMTACGSAPTTPVAAVPAPVVGVVTSSVGSVINLGGGNAQTTLTVTATDANGVPIAGVPVQVTVNGNLLPPVPTTLVAGAVANHNITGATGATGKATVVIQYVVANGFNVAVTAGGVISTPLTYVGSVPAPSLTFALASPYVADGYTAGHPVTITVKDNTGVLQSNQTFAFRLSSLTAGVSSVAALQTGGVDIYSLSDANGRIQLYLSDTVAEPAVTLTATAVDGTVITSAPFQFIAANADTVSLTSSTALAIPNTAITFTATVQSAAPAPLANAWVQFDAYAGGVRVGQSTGLTNATGIATANFSFAQVGTADVYATLVFNPNAATKPAVQQVQTVYATPQIIISPTGLYLADGYTATHPLRIQVNDNFGAPIANQSITLTTTGSAGFSSTSGELAGITPLTISTDIYGVIDVYVSDTMTELITITATPTAGVAATSKVQFITANAARVNVVAAPATALPDGVSPIVITATVTDANGVPVGNALVDFYTSNKISINQSIASALTSVAGVASVSLSSFKEVLGVDVYATVQASPSLITNAAVRTIISFVNPVATVLLQGSPATLRAPADNYTKITLTATVLDATGKRLQGRTVAFPHTSLATVSTPALSDSYGQTQIIVTDANVEAPSFTATVEGKTSTAVILNFVPIVNSVSLTVSPAQPSQIAADGVSTATLTATVLDAQSNPIMGQTVRFKPTQGTAPVLSTKATITDAYGHASITVVDGVAEDVYVTAFADLYTSLQTDKYVSAQAAMRFVDTNYLVSFTNIGPFLTGTALNTVTMTVKDRQTQNPVQNLSVSFSDNGIGTQLSPTQGSTGGAGTVAISISDSYAEPVIISGQVTGTPVIFTQAIQFVNKDAYSLSLTATPASVVPDGVAAATLTVLVSDVSGAAVANAHVQLTTTDVYAVITMPQGLLLTDAYGRATVSMVSQVATIATVVATLPSNGNASSLPVAVTFEAAVAQVVLQATPSTAFADGTQNITWTAYVLDAYSNRLSGRVVTVIASPVGTVQFAASNAVGLDRYTGVSDVYGKVQSTMSDTVAEVVTLTASAGGVSSLSVTVTFTPIVSSMNISVTPANTITAGGQVVINVLLKDPYGAPINGKTVYFVDDYAVLDPYGTQSSAQLSATSAQTVNGVASITVSNTVAEQMAVNVSYVQLEPYGTAPNINANKDAYTVLTFSPSNIRYLFEYPPTKAFVLKDSYVQVTMKDNAGNPLLGQQLDISSTSSNWIPTATRQVTDVYGRATFHFFDFVAEVVTLNFTRVGGIGLFPVPALVTINAANAAQILSLTATPNVGLAVNGVSMISATVVDAYSVFVAGATVDFYTYDTTKNNTRPSPGASLTARRAITNGSGVATINLSSNITGIVGIRASVDGYTTAGGRIIYSKSTTATFGQLPSQVNLTTPSTQGTADGTTPINVTVAVLDALGAPIPNQPVTLSFSPYTNVVATVIGVSLTIDSYGKANSVSTDAYGQVVVSIIDTVVEPVVVSADAKGKTGTLNLQFNQAVSAVFPVSVQFTNAIDAYKQPIGGQVFDVYTTPTSADTYSSYATGLDTVLVKFFVGYYDVYGVPVPLNNRTVAFSASGSVGGLPIVLPAIVLTTVDGYAQLSLTDAYAETVTLTATSGTHFGTQAIRFTNPPASNIVFVSTVPSPAVVGIKGSGTAQSVTMNFQIVDTNNNVVIDPTAVNFSIINGGLNGGELLTIFQSTSNAGLVSTVFNAGSKAGTVQVRASLNANPTIFADVTVTITGGLPSGDAFGLSPSLFNIEGRKTFNVTQTVTANASDFFSNPVTPNIQVQFQTDFANITGTSIFSPDLIRLSSVATATLTPAFPTPPDGFVTAVGQTIGGQHSKILSLAIDPYSNGLIIYAGTDGGGIFKTIDGGVNWAHVGVPLRTVGTSKFNNLLGSIVRDLKIDPNNTAVLYAATEKGIFLSRDGGHNWETLTGYARVSGEKLQNVLDPYGTGIFLSNGLWADSFGIPTLFRFHFSNSNIRSRMRVYLNGIETTQYVVSGNGLYLTGQPGTFFSVSGKTLTVDYDRKSNVGKPVYAIAFDRYSYDPALGYSRILYAGIYGDGVWTSTDGGAKWLKSSSMRNAGSTFDLRVTHLAVDTYALNQGHVFAGTDGGGLYIADAATKQWVQAVGTAPNFFANSVVQGITVQDPYIWVAGRNGINYTANYGQKIDYTGANTMAWQTATGINAGNQATNTDARGFAISPNGAMYAITFGDVLGTGTTARGGVYRSMNHGVTWTALSDVYTATGAHRLDSIDIYTALVSGNVTSAYDTLMVGTEGRAFYKGTFDQATGTILTWQKMNGTASNSITNTLFTTQQLMHSGSTRIQIQALTARYQPMNDYRFGSGFLATSPVSIYNGESVSYYIRVSDDLGNPLKGGSTISVTASAGKVTGDTAVSIPDAVHGATDYLVTWTNDIATAAKVDTPGTLIVNVTSVANGAANNFTPTTTLINPLAGTSTPVVVNPYSTAGSATILAQGGSNGANPQGYEFTSTKGCVGTIAGAGKTAVATCSIAVPNNVITAGLATPVSFVYVLPGTAAFTFTDTIIIRDLATNQSALGTITITAK